MRKSTIKGDPGYDADAHRYVIIFDGVEQTKTTGRLIRTADEEIGIVVFDKIGSDGALVADIVEHGTVKIRRR